MDFGIAKKKYIKKCKNCLNGLLLKCAQLWVIPAGLRNIQTDLELSGFSPVEILMISESLKSYGLCGVPHPILYDKHYNKSLKNQARGIIWLEISKDRRTGRARAPPTFEHQTCKHVSKLSTFPQNETP